MHIDKSLIYGRDKPLFLGLCQAVVFVLLGAHADIIMAFTLDDVAVQAQALAKKKFSAPASDLPASFQEIPLTDYKKIQFKRANAYWEGQGSAFKLLFHHLGMQFRIPVKINEVTATSVKEIKYRSEDFNFGGIKPPSQGEIKNFAGFSVNFPLNKKGDDEEILRFLGASYFSAIGAGQVYGLSARALAIDTALPSGEEYPFFKKFWVERPGPHEKHLVIYALLDSPRATGAYRFDVHPGKLSYIDVQAKIYLRSGVGKLGLAPLTSMFLFGANQPANTASYRPSVQNSEGLSILTGEGDWIWRPLNNPKRLSTSLFSVQNLKGFGLLQRNREFSYYQDLDNRYDLRPSGWVEPQSNWGKGTVELIEIPTADETNNNIIVFWKPAVLPAPGQETSIKYRISFTRNEEKLHTPDVAWVKSTLRSLGDATTTPLNLTRQPDGTLSFVIDFVEKKLPHAVKTGLLVPDVNIDNNGEIVEKRLMYNSVIGGWRLILHLRIKDLRLPTEIRASLMNGEKRVTEIWSYQLPANE